ncbi:MAG: hypothetical protein QXO51_04930 [Halobacteria archaeon]
MSAKLALLLLVSGALLVSGCTQSPAPAGGAPAGGAATGGAPAGGAPAGGAPAGTPVTQAGSPAAFAAAFVDCVAGTPWSFAGAAGSAASAYRVTYTVEGKKQFKGKEFCKVAGIYTVDAGGQSFTGNVDLYYRGFQQATPASEPAFEEMWVVSAAAGQTQELQLWAGGKQVK